MGKMQRLFFIAAISGGFFLPVTAMAGEVYLNGVNITHLKNQRFEGVSVEIDRTGNIYITGNQYEVSEERISPEDKRPSSIPDNRYFLVSEENFPGKSGQIVEVSINGISVATIRPGEATVKEVTSFLHTGENQVLFRASRNASDSSVAESYMRIYIGVGRIEGGNLIIENPSVEYQRKADDMSKDVREFRLQAR